MTQIVINHNGKMSNKQALDAVSRFVTVSYLSRNHGEYLDCRVIVINGGFALKVKESVHENKGESPCSVVFDVSEYKEE